MIARSHFAALVTTALISSFAASPAFAQAVVNFNLPAQELSKSLKAVARATNTNIVFEPAQVAGKEASALRGRLTAGQAFTRLTANQSLQVKSTGSGTWVVSAEGNGPAAAETAASKGEAVGGSAAAASESAEIIVTAQKRSERLLDVPVPVAALNAQNLSQSNKFRLQDYYATVPGLNFGTDNRGAPSLSIRGITTGAYVTPTVGYTIDDAPFGSSVTLSSFSPAPDIDPNELSQIEVLRGPQGTLYGASSLGGLVRYTTIAPSADQLSGRIQAGIDTVDRGGGLGYNLSGAINMPLSSTLAVRANAYARQEPGYVDNVESGQNDVNKTLGQGGRVSALWKPSSDLSVRLSALIQRSKADGSSQETPGPGLGAYQQAYLGNTGGYDRSLQAYAAAINAALGPAHLTSITSYNFARAKDSYDVSSGLAAYLGVGGVAFVDDNTTRNFSQEVRVNVPLTSHVDWLVGGFYTNQKTQTNNGFTIVDPTSFVTLSRGLVQVLVPRYREYSIFTDLTAHFTDRFSVQVGGRWSHNQQTFDQSESGPLTIAFYGVPSPYIAPREHSKDSSFTYLFAPQYKITPDWMIYARAASGYRPGGPNGTALGIPPSFMPDKTENYELGTKGSFLDRRLTVDASLFHIDWRDIQLSLVQRNTFIGYTGNGSRAKSDGAELTVTARPFPRTFLSGWAVWNSAKLTRNLPSNSSVVGAAGDRLPYSSRFSSNFSAEQTVPLGAFDGFFGGDVSYIGRREGELTFNGQRQVFPAYTRVDLRAGLQSLNWTLTAFVNNATNSRGLLSGGLGVFPFSFTRIQPRTIGLNVARTF